MSAREAFTCKSCGAQPGQPCLTRAGKECPPHVSRIQQENAHWVPDNPRSTGDIAMMPELPPLAQLFATDTGEVWLREYKGGWSWLRMDYFGNGAQFEPGYDGPLAPVHPLGQPKHYDTAQGKPLPLSRYNRLRDACRDPLLADLLNPDAYLDYEPMADNQYWEVLPSLDDSAGGTDDP